MTALGGGSGSAATVIVEGGGLRGAFAAGVLSELARAAEVVIARMIAVSSGAPTAAYLAAGQIDDGVRIWHDHTHGAQLIDPARLLRGRTLMDIDGLIETFRSTVPLSTRLLDESRVAVEVVLTNCDTGQPEYKRVTSENALELLRATMALPIAYGKVVRIDGVPYVDGGVADAVPIASIPRGATPALAILSRPMGFRRPRSLASLVTCANYPQYPRLRQAILSRWSTYNAAVEEVERRERAGELEVIRPASPLPSGRLSRSADRIRETIEVGRSAARSFLERRRAS